MSSVIILGAQWGDEGKGKFVDVITKDADLVVRFQGGNNAGHTIYLGEEKFVFHLLPSGVLYDNAKCIIASGVVVDIGVFLNEVKILESRGRRSDHIFISDKANLIMPYHIALDKAQESFKTNKIGTTQKGIGPTYSDKIARSGLRVADLMNFDIFEKKLDSILQEKNLILSKVYNQEEIKKEEILEIFSEYRKQIRHRIINSEELIYNSLNEGKNVVFEGAQGAMLDIDFGNYPFCTSSSVSTGGALIGSGITYNQVDRVVGISKAYATRVGEGPFITELDNEVGNFLRKAGNEFGATTGRPRRCGYLDLVVLKAAVRRNALTDIVITKLDILSDLDEIKICKGYEIEGKETTTIPTLIEDFGKIKPIYKTFKGWKKDISSITSFKDLPIEAKDYINFIKDSIQVDIAMISVGAERNQNIFIKEDFFKTKAN